MTSNFDKIAILVRHVTGNEPSNVSEACLYMCIWAEDNHDYLVPYLIDREDLSLILDILSSQFDRKALLHLDEAFEYINGVGGSSDSRIGEPLNPIKHEDDKLEISKLLLEPLRKRLGQRFKEYCGESVKVGTFYREEAVTVYVSDDILLATFKNIKKIDGKEGNLGYSCEVEIPFISSIEQARAMLNKKTLSEYDIAIDNTGTANKCVVKFVNFKDAAAMVMTRKYVQSANQRGLNLPTDGRII